MRFYEGATKILRTTRHLDNKEMFEKDDEVGALFPFTGSEWIFLLICIAGWIIWHIWQIKFENNTYDEQTSKLQGNLSKAITGD